MANKPGDIIVRRNKCSADVPLAAEEPPFIRKIKFELYGVEMIEGEVKQSRNSGRVYPPPEWVGKRVKIIRIE